VDAGVASDEGVLFGSCSEDEFDSLIILGKKNAVWATPCGSSSVTICPENAQVLERLSRMGEFWDSWSKNACSEKYRRLFFRGKPAAML
jgi:hypothetical protein